jgi:hypothetical protein
MDFTEGDRIRVALLRSPFVGSYVGTRGDTLFFGTPGQPPMAFRFNAVDSIWRPGRATTHGAWIGAIVGGAAAGAAHAFGNAVDGTAAIIGPFGGAAIGAIIGSAIKRWRLVYGDAEPRGLDARRATSHARTQ